MLSSRVLSRAARQATSRSFRSYSSQASPGDKMSIIGPVIACAGAFAAGWYVAPGKIGRQYHTSQGKTGPIPKIDPERGYPYNFEKPPTPSEVTDILSQTTWSFTDVGVPGVSRCDGAQVASNGKIEDRFACGKFASPFKSGKSPETDWLAVGVFDGHCGSATSEAVSKAILPYVYNSLSKLTPSAQDAAVDAAIKEAFEALDDRLVRTAEETLASKATFAEKLTRVAPAVNGSCALLSLFDPATRTLRVACTGDSRAVLGVKKDDGTWEVIPMSEDQNVDNAAEVERVHREHPGEDNLFNNRYYMNLEPMRVFGDARNKWSLEMFNDAAQKYNTNYYGKKRPINADRYKTPPYHTARPEIKTIKLEKGRPAFLIVATDGLWDTMSNEQGVNLVGKWMDWVAAGRVPAKSRPTTDFEPYTLEGVDDAPQFDERRMTVQDNNAAVHLLRNALGGAQHELISGLLALKSPWSRQVRDDMTAQVVFFQG